jgi:hypothetical protein
MSRVIGLLAKYGLWRARRDDTADSLRQLADRRPVG